MNDPLTAVKLLAPPGEAHPEILDRVRTDLSALIASSPGSLRRRRRTRLTVALAAAAVLTMATVALALSFDSSRTTSIRCPGERIIDAVSGDPVLDCREAWRQQEGSEPPAMVAYDNGFGGIDVLVAGEVPPEGYTPLAPGTVQDPAVLELRSALDDVGDGLESGCFDAEAAARIAQEELTRLELDTWTVEFDRTRLPNGVTSCATALVDAQEEQVVIIGLGGPADDPWRPFADGLRRGLEDRCMGLDEAAGFARDLIGKVDIVVDGQPLDYDPADLVVHQIEDPDATCTRADIEIGGNVVVTLRGPAPTS